MPKKGEYNPVTERYWRSAIAGWERSGLPAREYCEKNNILYTGFINWRKRLPERDAERVLAQDGGADFAPVRVLDADLPVPVCSGGAMVMEVLLPDGIVLRLSENCSMKLLASVATLLGRM
jgi:hypothetical protein